MEAKTSRRLTLSEITPLIDKKKFKQLCDIKAEEFFIPPNSWLKSRILFRLAWLGTLIGIAITLPFIALKVAFKLVTLHPIQFLKTLILAPLACAGLALISIASFLAPSICVRFSRFWLKRNIKLDINKPLGYKNVKVFTAPSDKGTVSAARTIKPKQGKKHIMFYEGMGGFHENPEVRKSLNQTCKLLQRPVSMGNHPSLNPSYSGHKKPKSLQDHRDYNAKSRTDLVNAAAAPILHLATKDKKNILSNDDISENVQLYGHSLGGAIALEVAVHLKEKFGIDVPVHIDRSFRSLLAVMAAHLNQWTGMPWHCARMLTAMALYGAGDLNFDSVAACEKLNKLADGDPKIYYYNLGHQEEKPFAKPPSKSRFHRLLEHFKMHRYIRVLEKHRLINVFDDKNVDYMIPEGTSLTDGLADANETWCGSHKKIFTQLNVERKDHLVFYNGTHIGKACDELPLHNLDPVYFKTYEQAETSSDGTYETAFRENVLSCDQQPSKEDIAWLRCIN